MSFSHALSINRYGESDLIVSTNLANGTHSTLTSAMAAAVSGQTIFLRDSVTENVTITPGVNISAWSGGNANTPTIIGTITMTGAGTSNISGIKLQTNGAASIAVTGSANSILNITNCYLNFTNNTGITYSSSGTSSAINISSSMGDIGTTGITLFIHTGANTIFVDDLQMSNSGGSTTASTISGGFFFSKYSRIPLPITSSSTASMFIFHSDIDATNTTSLTIGGSGNHEVAFTRVASGSASAISISGGSTLQAHVLEIISTNAVTITGAGTLLYSGIFSTQGTTMTMNVATATARNAFTGSISFDNGVNYLSAYATATFTPVIVSSGTQPTTIGYSVQSGTYTRIGNQVTVSVVIALNAFTLGAGTGTVRISNLPFTSASVTSMNWVGALRIDNVTFTGSYVTANVPTGQAYADIIQYATASGSSGVPIAGISSSSVLITTITYQV